MANMSPPPATSRPPALELSDIHLHRDGTDVIGKISSRVEQDQRWVILGANGSGKTSLMRIMALYDHPTSGTVEVLGERLGRTDVRTLRQRIGLASTDLLAARSALCHRANSSGCCWRER